MQNKERLDKHDASLVEHVNLIQGVDRRIGDLEKIAHNAMLWRVEDYTRKLKESKAGNLETLFSPTFTTSKHGYRLCASVCLNGDGKGKGTHMSIFVSLLKGTAFRIAYIVQWQGEVYMSGYLKQELQSFGGSENMSMQNLTTAL